MLVAIIYPNFNSGHLINESTFALLAKLVIMQKLFALKAGFAKKLSLPCLSIIN
jgi:hypothetical protein